MRELRTLEIKVGAIGKEESEGERIEGKGFKLELKVFIASIFVSFDFHFNSWKPPIARSDLSWEI